MALTEQCLLQQYATGDTAAFDRLYVLLWPGIVQGALRELRDLDRAEDVAQTVLTALAAEPSAVPRDADPCAWLAVCARNQARKRLRSDGRRLVRERRSIADTDPPQPTPEGPVIEHEMVQHIRQAIGALPDRYRQPLILHHLQGLTKAETASRLGLKEATVSMQLDRARGMMRLLLSRRGVSATGLMLALPALCRGQGSLAEAGWVRDMASAADPGEAHATLAAGRAPAGALAGVAGLVLLGSISAVALAWGDAGEQAGAPRPSDASLPTVEDAREGAARAVPPAPSPYPRGVRQPSWVITDMGIWRMAGPRGGAGRSRTRRSLADVRWNPRPRRR